MAIRIRSRNRRNLGIKLLHRSDIHTLTRQHVLVHLPRIDSNDISSPTLLTPSENENHVGGTVEKKNDTFQGLL